MRACTVSYRDMEDVTHSVEVQADSLYEAAALAIRQFKDHGYEPGQASELRVEVREPVITHTLTPKRLRDWLDGGARSPKERILKERLKALQ